MSPRKALIISYLDRYAAFVVGFLASVAVARLLTPAEVGVFSVSMVLVGFLGPFRDFGATQFVVRAPQLHDEKLRAVRTIQMALGTLLAMIIAGAGPLVAAFYGDERIRGIMWLLALNSLLMPIGALSTAVMTRDLQMGELAASRFAGAFGGAALTVLLAWLGYGPISLAYGSLAGSVTTYVLAAVLRPVHVGWRPTFRGAREVLGFGGAMTITHLLTLIQRSIGELALGKLQSLAVAGVFGRAQSLVLMLERLLMEGTYSVGVPLFAAAHREGRPLAPIYLRAIGIMCAIGWPFFGLVACLADPIVRLLYGSNWLGSIPVLQALCVALMVMTPNLIFTMPLVAIGRVGPVLRVAAASALGHGIAVSAAATHSVEAAYLAIIAMTTLTSLAMLWIIRRELALPLRDLLRTMGHAAAVAGAGLAAPLFVLFFTTAGQPPGLAGAAVAIIGAVALGSLAAIRTRHALYEEVARLIGRS